MFLCNCMFTVYIHKVIIPQAIPNTYATFQLIFGSQKYNSRIVLPLTPEYSEYNMYNERFVFQDPNATVYGLSVNSSQQRVETHSVYLKVTCYVDC